jgi:uncharacterized repeat protein (TIGR03803 family)
VRAISVFLGSVILANCSGATGLSARSPLLPNRTSASELRPPSGYKSIFAFDFTDGAAPYAGIIYAGGRLYGTTYAGGSGGTGTVFKITTGGSEKVLHSFKGGSDGAQPEAALIAVSGTLYGTAVYGGASGNGVVFKVTTDGAEKVLHSFKGGSDGSQSEAPLIDVGGTLYGTTVGGGGAGRFGTIYKITTSGSEKVLYAFRGGSKDGADPGAGLTDVKGTLYGTTSSGGPNALGTVFKVTTAGSEKVLHVFSGSDGATPISSLTNLGGTLFGTTSNGGSKGFGTVFKITTAGFHKVLYSFRGGSDGAYPTHTGLADVNGILYGVTSSGGTASNGTAFKITTAGKETVLYSFLGGNDGAQPTGILALVKGVLYGTTFSGGGASGGGTVYSISP